MLTVRQAATKAGVSTGHMRRIARKRLVIDRDESGDILIDGRSFNAWEKARRPPGRPRKRRGRATDQVAQPR